MSPYPSLSRVSVLCGFEVQRGASVAVQGCRDEPMSDVVMCRGGLVFDVGCILWPYSTVLYIVYGVVVVIVVVITDI